MNKDILKYWIWLKWIKFDENDDVFIYIINDEWRLWFNKKKN